MNDLATQILLDCGINKISNEIENIHNMVNLIKEKYCLEGFNNNIYPFLLKYNGLSVDASVALRKTMKVYNFQGGFQVSLKYIIDWHEYLFEELCDIKKEVGVDLFPIGNAFDEILSISDNNSIYVGNTLVADDWNSFIEELVDDNYHYTF